MPRTPEPEPNRPLLEVENLAVEVDTDHGPVGIVRGVTFSVRAGESLGVVGESGSGKSVTARTILGLMTSRRTRSITGRISFDGRDLLAMSHRELRMLRGQQISMVYQDPLRAMNPTMRVGNQIVEALRAHGRNLSRHDARDEAIRLLAEVQIPDAAVRAHAYPHEFSGGMRQRAMIAMAISCRPRLLIADEPTTALDVTVQDQILRLLGRLRVEHEMALILITHDLGVAAANTDRMAVMYAGRVVERGSTDQLVHGMRMPYTRALFDALPRLDGTKDEPLQAIAGRPPNPRSLPGGCAFHPRCSRTVSACSQENPPFEANQSEHGWECWNPLSA